MELSYLTYIGAAAVVFLCVRFYSVYLSYFFSRYYKETKNSYGKLRRNKGLWGEYEVVRTLEKTRGKKKILLNRYFQRANGSTTEIDIILINSRGIFSVECKNFSGWVYGDEESRSWTQTMPNGQAHSFYNPIAQNKIHINALKKLLGTEIPFYSMVVFSDDCRLKHVRFRAENTFVINRRKLKRRVNARRAHRLSASDISYYYDEIKENTFNNRRIQKEHVKYVKKKYHKKWYQFLFR